VIGGGHPIVVQSMCATRTSDVDATVAQVAQLTEAGAGIVRIAVDTRGDAQALAEIRRRTQDTPRPATLSVDLQENYRLVLDVAPWVDKVRYNPGHLYHHERERPWPEKVGLIAETAAEHGCALRVGVNCGSVDPTKRAQFPPDDRFGPMLASALEHCALLDKLGVTNFCVSLKDSCPMDVVEVNRRFAAERPDVPLHLGVTEAGMPPEGILKTQAAFEKLIPEGIGDTIRVSLTLPAGKKHREVEAGYRMLDEIIAGRRLSDDELSVSGIGGGRLNIVSCPSCSRVQNEAFIELAHEVREATRYAADEPFTIAVMGCRVNGPGETDHADLGLWCGPNLVNLKRGGQHIGAFGYDEIIPRVRHELDRLIAEKSGTVE
jgi:(E)-4-hydroxy-3-methylbut-2-enyl-diphosphate synthase